MTYMEQFVQHLRNHLRAKKRIVYPCTPEDWLKFLHELEEILEKSFECKKPPLTLLLSHTKGGTTVKGILMDITLHVGGREYFALSGIDAFGDPASLKGALVTENTADPALAIITTSPTDPTTFAVDGLAVGKTTGLVSVGNADGTTAAPLNLTITILADDVVEVSATQVGNEVAATGPAFPPVIPPPLA